LKVENALPLAPTGFTRALGSRNSLRRVLAWLERLSKARAPRQLRVAENVTLGEKRFLALVECEQQKFLIAGTSAAVVLLAKLTPTVEENRCG